MLIKKKHETEQIKKGGIIIGEILEKLGKMCKPGVSTGEIDRAAEEMIVKAGGRPAFKGHKNYPDDTPFPSTICASYNQQIVHGIARDEDILEDGDIFTIDIGMEWPCKNPKRDRGFFTDTALTVIVGKVPAKTKELLRVTRQSLEEAIKVVKPGNSIADIGRAVENYVNSQGKYGIIRDLVGHGVGHAVHEEPTIPNYYDPRLGSFILKPGMVLAIEPMISLGTHKVKTGADGWTIEMADGSLCAHFEHTVIVTENGCEVATRRPGENKK